MQLQFPEPHRQQQDYVPEPRRQQDYATYAPELPVPQHLPRGTYAAHAHSTPRRQPEHARHTQSVFSPETPGGTYGAQHPPPFHGPPHTPAAPAPYWRF